MKNLLLIFSSLFILVGCEEEIEEKPQPIKSVKYVIIDETSQGQIRTVPGTVEAVNTASLSFEVAGKVEKVNVVLGENVQQGKILASLEKRDFELEVQSQQADLLSAKATLAEKQEQYQRQVTLNKKDFVSQAAVDTALADFEAAKSRVKVAETKVENAQRNLERTDLKAPFSGQITQKLIDAFEEVQAKEVIFVVQKSGLQKITTLVPETFIRTLKIGDKISAVFPTLNNSKATGVISEIGAQAETGNAFAVKVILDETPLDIRSGMTAQVSYTVEDYTEQDKLAYLIPVSSIDLKPTKKPSDPSAAHVFIFNSETSKLELREVLIGNVRENKIEVFKGLKPGDILIVSGVTFLTDGQEVKLWEPKYKKPETIPVEKLDSVKE